jgi:hypothetical protein
MPPVLLALIIFEISGLVLCPGGPAQNSSCFKLQAITRMTSMHHHAQLFSIEMGSCQLFYLDWPVTTILPFSASDIDWDGRTPCLSWAETIALPISASQVVRSVLKAIEKLCKGM